MPRAWSEAVVLGVGLGVPGVLCMRRPGFFDQVQYHV